MADDWAGNGLRGMEKSLSFGFAVLEPGTLAEEVSSADNIIINNNKTIIILQYSIIFKRNLKRFSCNPSLKGSTLHQCDQLLLSGD